MTRLKCRLPEGGSPQFHYRLYGFCFGKIELVHADHIDQLFFLDVILRILRIQSSISGDIVLKISEDI